jgi:hypothetical protein
MNEEQRHRIPGDDILESVLAGSCSCPWVQELWKGKDGRADMSTITKATTSATHTTTSTSFLLARCASRVAQTSETWFARPFHRPCQRFPSDGWPGDTLLISRGILCLSYAKQRHVGRRPRLTGSRSPFQPIAYPCGSFLCFVLVERGIGPQRP